MKIDQIVYLLLSPLSKRDNDILGIDIFLNHKIKVKVLDCSSYIDKEYSKKYENSSTCTYDYVEKFNNYTDIKRYILSTNKNTIFISCVGESHIKSLKILTLLTAHKKEFGIFLSGSLPGNSRTNRLMSKLHSLNRKSMSRLLGKLFYKISPFSFNYSFIVASGEESYKIIKSKYNNSAIIKGHTFDYDLFLQNKKKIDITDKKYIIFLDVFLPFHPDFIIDGKNYNFLANSYYDKLSKYFDYIEKKFQLDVIIAAHPKSYYDKLPNYWKHRKFILGDTINLVKNAKMCLLHASTSINFAVLYNIPTIFLTSVEVKRVGSQRYVESMANELNSTIVNLDNFDNESPDISFDKECYKKYIKKFIKAEDGDDLNSWELLYNHYNNS